MDTPKGKSKVLPENAFTRLQPGEAYQPVVPAATIIEEVNRRSVIMGLVMVVIFTFAAAYIGLKTGNVIEASIPIVILAVFFGKLYRRQSTILENVIIQSIGQASGVVVAGAVFTIPALYINELHPSFWQIFLSCLVGGCLGVVMLIPLRRYFCRDLHGELPFPEATAITEVLAAGETAGSSSGKILLYAFGIGFIYDLFVEFIHFWNGHLNSKVLFGKFGSFLSDLRMEWRLNATAVYFGLGYIIGIRYSAIIAAGSVLSFLVLVPLAYHFGQAALSPLTPPVTETLIHDMTAQNIFTSYIQPIGIGCIAMAGFIGIIKMGKIILSSLSLAFKGLTGGKTGLEEAERTDRDMQPKNALLIQIAAVAGMLVLFYFISSSLKVAVVGTVITFFLVFLFTPVAARAIAIVGVNPVSGMTLITLIISCLCLVAVGLSGDAHGQTIALVIGCAVCTALATSGAFISDLKIGYWIGASPFKQQRWKFLGILVASLCVGGVIWIMANSFGFTVIDETGASVPNPDLQAPQGNLMAAVVSSLMGGENPPLLLYGLGGLIAVLLEMASVPALAFGLGMYLPIQITMSIFSGGVAGYFIGRSGKTEEIRKIRKEQGTLIASGLMAGAAIIGTIGAILLLPAFGAPMALIDLGQDTSWYESFGSQLLSVVMFLLLMLLCYGLARKGARMELEETENKP